MNTPPVRPEIATGLDRVALGEVLLQQGTRELERLRRVRGAHRRTARQIRRELAVLVLAAGLLGVPLASVGWAVPPSPCFQFPQLNPFGLGAVSGFASPALADIDGDGDLDAFVGQGSGGDMVFFENIGTAVAPAFAAPQANPFGLAGVGTIASPDFADIDDDGDLDAFVGEYYGNTIFFENTGTAAAPAFAAPQTNPFGLAGVTSFASPALADIDGDGDFDAFVGENDNTIFFENTGTAAGPAFAAPQANPFGLAAVGFASPDFADIDGDGDLDAFVGQGAGGYTIFFENTGTATVPAFATPQTNPFGLTAVGGLASPSLADIDGDGDLDAFICETHGGYFSFFSDMIFFENDCSCGDGVLVVGEGCDDGNTWDGDCCSSTCQYEPADSPCPDDDLCNGDETCDGAGTCAPGTPHPATNCADDWDKGSLLIKESTPGQEKLIVKMTKGPALLQSAFGDPLEAGGTAYTACVYDDAGNLVGSMVVDRAGQTCGTNDCWKPVGLPPPNGRGYLFKDNAAASDGITQIKLRGGPAGKSSVQIQGANRTAQGEAELPVGLTAGLASSSSATVQLFGSDTSECVSLTVDDIKKQEADFFKATK